MPGRLCQGTYYRVCGQPRTHAPERDIPTASDPLKPLPLLIRSLFYDWFCAVCPGIPARVAGYTVICRFDSAFVKEKSQRINSVGFFQLINLSADALWLKD